MMAFPSILGVRRLLERSATPIATVITLAALMVLAHQAARVTWLLYPATAAETRPVSSPISADRPRHSEASKTSDVSVDAVVATQLFGEPAPDNPQPKEPATETQLDARLGGVYHSPKDGQSIALISIDGGDTELFREGDRLGADARVLRIRKEAVLLERAGQHERLSLVREAGSTAGATQAPSVSDEARRTASERQRSRPDKVPTTSLIDTTDRRRKAPGPRPAARRMD